VKIQTEALLIVSETNKTFLSNTGPSLPGLSPWTAASDWCGRGGIPIVIYFIKRTYLPELGTNLVTALACLNVDDFSHGCLFVMRKETLWQTNVCVLTMMNACAVAGRRRTAARESCAKIQTPSVVASLARKIN
jgi:hypothetical protein